eukprot:6797961-Lingulodinium_polyedra.AAC.1
MYWPKGIRTKTNSRAVSRCKETLHMVKEVGRQKHGVLSQLRAGVNYKIPLTQSISSPNV